jgi:hypothetical protein
LLLPLSFALGVLASAAPASELCVTDGEYFCCQTLCDLPAPVGGSGYSTSGPPTCTQGSPVFSISSSGTDPYVDHGTLESPYLYLWVAADAGYGYRSGWLTLGGDLQVVDLTPEQPSVYWSPQDQYLDVVGCFFEPTRIATLLVYDTVHIDAETWGRIKALWE